MNATPKPPEGSKRAKREPEKLTRYQRMKKAGVLPPMPPNPAPHIVDRLVEIGLTEAAGMGVVPLSWSEIVAWQQGTSIRLAPWEARLIRTLSAAYVAESRRAESENAPSPWRAPVSECERAADLRALEQVLGAFE